MKFIDFFSGAGMFRKGMELAGHECVGYVEIEPNARKTYEENFNTENEWTEFDINQVNAKGIPVADIWCGGFPCFEKDMLVMTSEGYKKIQDIKSGDYVLTHTNGFQKVLFPMVNHAKSIYELNIFGSERFKATENHPFYVREMFKKWDKNRRSQDRLFKEPEWVEVKDLDKKHYIGVAINQEEKLPEWNGITFERQNKTFELNNLDFTNKDFWWLIGRYIGDGWYRVAKRKDRPNHPNYRIIICCSKNKNEINEIKRRLDGLFHYTIAEEKTTYKFHIVNKELTTYLMQFGKYAHGKHLTSDIFNLPVEYLKMFLEGYFSADGCLLTDSTQYHSNTVSRELAYGLQACIHKAYKRPCALYKVTMKDKAQIEGRIVNQRDQYYIRFKEKRKQDKAFYEDGYIWVPFKEKKLVEYNDYVYNLEVENDHSYTVQNLIVHNCKNMSTANVTTRFGLEGEQSGLFWTVLNLLRGSEYKPKYLFLENVRGFISIHGGLDFLQAVCAIDELGYDIHYEVTSALKYGVPQNRIRTYLICKLREEEAPEIETPEIEIKTKTININNLNIHKLYKYIQENEIKVKINWNDAGAINSGLCTKREITWEQECTLKLKDILEEEVDEKYYLSEEQLDKIRYLKGSKVRTLPDGRLWKEGAVPFPDSIEKNSRCVTPSDGSINRSTHVIFDGKGYRKLTLRERARLQCLPDDFVFNVSDSQVSLQLGNGVVVEVIRAIAAREIQ